MRLTNRLGRLGSYVEEESGGGDKSGEGFWSESEEDPDEIEVADSIEESSLLDSADALIEEETANDFAESDESVERYQEAVPEDETRLVHKTDEIELEPYGIDKEQCWQCGKIDSIGEPFIARNGRLYCKDCAPIGEIRRQPTPKRDRNRRALSLLRHKRLPIQIWIMATMIGLIIIYL